MREILFQGKRVDNGEWVEGDVVHGNYIHSEMMIICKTDGLYDIVDSDTVSQFTGLTDRNDKKVFEGDIIKYSGGGKCHKGEVVYFEGAYRIKELFEAITLTLDKVMWTMEVIGNKWDNPELLESVK